MQFPGQASISAYQVPDGTLLLDVRESDEWDDGHIEGSIHIPMGEIPAAVARGLDWLDSETPVVVVCAVGARSARVANWLNFQGYQAINLDGGLQAWVQAGRPLVR